MPTTNTYRSDGTLATKHISAEKSAEDIASAESKARLSSTAGTGLGEKGKSLQGAPKMLPGESPAAFGERMRQFREAETQKRAFK
jgi:hypothetical protein